MQLNFKNVRDTANIICGVNSGGSKTGDIFS